MPRSSAVPRVLSMLRDCGLHPWVVEQYNSFSGKRQDLYGFIDILAIDSKVTLGVQVCGTDFSSHVKKLRGERAEGVAAWLASPHRRCLLVGVRKVREKRGGRRMVYRPRVAEVFFQDGEVVLIEVKGATIAGILGLDGPKAIG